MADLEDVIAGALADARESGDFVDDVVDDDATEEESTEEPVAEGEDGTGDDEGDEPTGDKKVEQRSRPATPTTAPKHWRLALAIETAMI